MPHKWHGRGDSWVWGSDIVSAASVVLLWHTICHASSALTMHAIQTAVPSRLEFVRGWGGGTVARWDEMGMFRVVACTLLVSSRGLHSLPTK
jgi:hypothetical protein